MEAPDEDCVEVAFGLQNATMHDSLEFHADFQRQIVRDLLAENMLIVLGQGLGVHAIAAAVLHIADISGSQRTPTCPVPMGAESLVVVIGANEKDLLNIQHHLSMFSKNSLQVQRGLQVFNANVVFSKRAAHYARGGLYAVTSRILVVDMLNGIININKIAGIIVMNAERVSENSSEAFILRLLRSCNKSAFIKAFSEEPNSISSGINGLKNRLSSLALDKVALWPRFHLGVDRCLPKAKVDEFIIELGSKMVTIQSLLSDCIQSCISDLKRRVPQLDTEHWTLDAALASNLSRAVKMSLDPVWHRLSWAGKQSSGDLGTLQEFLVSMTYLDPFRFLEQLELERLAALHSENPSPWLSLPAATELFKVARERVATMEELPKWQHLVDVLKELNISEAHEKKRVLIMTSTLFTARQVRDYLWMQSEYIKYLALEHQLRKETWGSSFDEKPQPSEAENRQPRYKRRRVRGGGSAGSGGRTVQTTQETEPAPAEPAAAEPEPTEPAPAEPAPTEPAPTEPAPTEPAPTEPAPTEPAPTEPAPTEPAPTEPLEPTQTTEQPEPAPTNGHETESQPEPPAEPLNLSSIPLFESVPIVLHPESESIPPTCILIATYDTPEVLSSIHPSTIIMYEPDLRFTRTIELYQASHSPPPQVVFMYYQKSVEELRYLSVVRREKDAFSKLIHEKGNMPMFIDDASEQEKQSQTRVVSTRVGGQVQHQVLTDPPQIVVDAREFRSALPFLIWRRGIKVIPMTLLVGDYILTPKIVVERKSVSDLISSFRDGRLYTQCESMFRHYQTPILLIEFDNDRSFSLEQFREIRFTSSRVQQEIHEKLALLLLTFPKLKILWSASPRQTAELFSNLKATQKEPNPKDCVETGQDVELNLTALSMLKAIPGVTAANYVLLTSRVSSMSQLVDLPFEELEKTMGKETSVKITRFLDASLNGSRQG